MKHTNPNYKKPHSFNSDKAMSTATSGSADFALGVLREEIYKELKIDHNRFTEYMDNYLLDRRNGIPQNVKDRASARGNVRKEIIAPNITWKVLCKALRFINVRKFKLSVELTHSNGLVTYHSTATINLGEPNYHQVIEKGKTNVK